MKNNFSNIIKNKIKDFNINEKVEEIHRDLQIFFDIELEEEPKIIYLNSRKELDETYEKYSKEKPKDWVIAFVNDDGIFIVSYDKFEEISNGIHKKEEFLQILKHEFVHKYFREKAGTGFPNWLNEGLANYLSDKEKKKPSDEDLLDVFEFFNKGYNNSKVYSIGYFWTKYLIENFGKEKLLDLLTSIKNYQADNLKEEIFKEVFYKVYGFEYSKENFEKILLNKK